MLIVSLALATGIATGAPRAPSLEEAARQIETTGGVTCSLTADEGRMAKETEERILRRPRYADYYPQERAGCVVYQITVDWRGLITKMELLRSVGNLRFTARDFQFRGQIQPTNTKPWTGLLSISSRVAPEHRKRTAEFLRSLDKDR